MNKKISILKIRVNSNVDRSDRLWIGFDDVNVTLTTNSVALALPLHSDEDMLHTAVSEVLASIYVEGYALSERYAERVNNFNSYLDDEHGKLVTSVTELARAIRDTEIETISTEFSHDEMRISFIVDRFNIKEEHV